MNDKMAAFIEKPWGNSHPAYDASSFNIRPAPEFATAEVVVASTYRAAGFPGHTERKVPQAGRDLDRAASRAKTIKGGASQISSETWRTILHGALQSPRQPNQSARRFLQLSPVVPSVALYSGSARLTGNSWDPGRLVATMVELGTDSDSEAQQLWADLQVALAVGENDDIWARWLQQEFLRRGTLDVAWSPQALTIESRWPVDERVRLRFPARQFAQDLRAIIGAKPHVTRRQWVSLLEAVVRIAAVSHVLWLCDVNDRLWRLAQAVIEGAEVPDGDTLGQEFVSVGRPLLGYGVPALPPMRHLASRYLTSRIGINLLLYALEEVGCPISSMSSLAEVSSLMSTSASAREALRATKFDAHLGGLLDRETRTIACKRGIGSNLVEFCRYTLGQRQTADDSLRGYDQGYQLKKKAEYASAPWVVSLGPVALLALAHCCLAEAAGPRSVQRLSEHLLAYGLKVDRDHFTGGDLGRNLRMLGLVLDSPDAESGMLLVPPFDSTATIVGPLANGALP